MPSAGEIPTWLQVTVCSAHLTQRVVIFYWWFLTFLLILTWELNIFNYVLSLFQCAVNILTLQFIVLATLQGSHSNLRPSWVCQSSLWLLFIQKSGSSQVQTVLEDARWRFAGWYVKWQVSWIQEELEQKVRFFLCCNCGR